MRILVLFPLAIAHSRTACATTTLSSLYIFDVRLAVSAYGGSKKIPVRPILYVTLGPHTRDQSPEHTRTRARRADNAANHSAIDPALPPHKNPAPTPPPTPPPPPPEIFGSSQPGSPSSLGARLSFCPTSQACLACRSFSFTGLSAYSAVFSGESSIELQKFAPRPTRSLTVSWPAYAGRARSIAPDPK